jgi:hypothetical protein
MVPREQFSSQLYEKPSNIMYPWLYTLNFVEDERQVVSLTSHRAMSTVVVKLYGFFTSCVLHRSNELSVLIAL